ncbi:Opioid growth factor receptor [Bagarius yarrelli]|uniref:Opioid growth factor receptor n=1 Tax=Bagarius yarrelli TaxID=175774 RepID=A0A556V7W8_BAGYA|nr:Opioid growth factor receptor [Bagarius yarrelli]
MENPKRTVGHDEVYDSIREDEHKDDSEKTEENSFMAQRNLYAMYDMQIFREKAEEAFEKMKDLTDEFMEDDQKIKERMLVSYKLMLDFYGIKLVDDETGEVARAENWSERFENLNRNSHNNLRITRILKCLGLLGFERYQAPLVRFFLEETLMHGTLPRVKRSALDYFIFAVLDKTEQKRLIEFACQCKSEREYVWCPSTTFQNRKEMENYNGIDSPDKDWSSDSTSQSHQKDLINGGVQNKENIASDAKKDTSDDDSLSSENRNVENVSGVCQESDAQTFPILTAGNANTADSNEDTEGYLQRVVSVQEDDSKTGNNEISSTEHLDDNGNDNAALAERPKDQSDHKNGKDKNPPTSHGSTSENVANQTPSSGISESEQQEQGDKSDQDNNNELFDKESKEETQQHGCESQDDGAATGSSTNSEGNSADTNSSNYTESDKNILGNPHGDILDTSKKEENEIIKDPVNRGSFMEESPKDRVTDVCNNVTSNTDTHSDANEAKDGDNTASEQATAHRSGVTPSQAIHGNDSDEGKETAMKEEQTESGCVRGEGSEKEGND